MAYSRQRELIVHTLTECKSHPTADELYAMIRLEYPGISLATVYRNLNQLEQNGQIMRVSAPRGADRFDAVNDGHLHMVCEKCGQVFDIDKEILPDICSITSEATEHDIGHFQIIFYGICMKCNNPMDKINNNAAKTKGVLNYERHHGNKDRG